jgi:hypothetical protein
VLYNTKQRLHVVRWDLQELNVVLQQKRLLPLEKEMQEKKVLRVRENDRTYSSFLKLSVYGRKM